MHVVCTLHTYICSLIQDRSLNLIDGTRLLDMKCYEATKAASNLSDSDMSNRYVHILPAVGRY